MPHTVFLSVDNQPGALELVSQAGVVAIELLDLSCRGIRLWAALLRGERHQLGFAHLFAPTREHRRVNAFATQERAQLSARLAAICLGQQATLLTPGEPAATRDRGYLWVRRRCARGRLYSRPSGSFRDVLER